jgi:hypothetical protein
MEIRAARFVGPTRSTRIRPGISRYAQNVEMPRSRSCPVIFSLDASPLFPRRRRLQMALPLWCWWLADEMVPRLDAHD